MYFYTVIVLEIYQDNHKWMTIPPDLIEFKEVLIVEANSQMEAIKSVKNQVFEKYDNSNLKYIAYKHP